MLRMLSSLAVCIALRLTLSPHRGAKLRCTRGGPDDATGAKAGCSASAGC